MGKVLKGLLLYNIIEGIEGMVSNNFRILDCGEIKYVDTINMSTYKILCKRYEFDWMNKTRHNDRHNDIMKQLNELSIKSNRVPTMERFDLIQEIKILENELKRYPFVDMTRPDEMSKDDIFRYYGKENFNPCIMINMSPNWKGKLPTEEYKFANKFIDVVMKRFYGDSNRFSKMKYVIECGKDGDFVHLHSVLELNPIMRNSNRSWIRKGNHLRDLRTIWNKACVEFEGFGGYVDCLKGKYALQSTLLNCNELIKDKLNYLIEELKPISHQNDNSCPLYPHIVNRGFD